MKLGKQDATCYQDKWEEAFDKILLDVPCLGLGVLKRKPDIKWQRKEEDIVSIQSLQLELLRVCSNYLKPGGQLVYSTCSILKEENETIIEEFLKKQNVEKSQKKKLFQVIEQINLLPTKNSDGFFMCKIQRI